MSRDFVVARNSYNEHFSDPYLVGNPIQALSAYAGDFPAHATGRLSSDESYSITSSNNATARHSRPHWARIQLALDANDRLKKRLQISNTWSCIYGHILSNEDSSEVGVKDPISEEARVAVSAIYSKCKNESDVRALRAIFDFVEFSFAGKKIAVVDSALGMIDVDQLHYDFLIAFLRSTSRARSKLNNWNLLLLNTLMVLKEQGQDSHRLLRGLIDKNGFVSKQASAAFSTTISDWDLYIGVGATATCRAGLPRLRYK